MTELSSTGALDFGHKPEPIVRLVLTSAVGTAIEWYDFFVFGLLSAVAFDTIFFPKLDGASATIASLSTFAVGYVARPLGGVVFGHLGDRVGRKAILFTTIVLMGVSTTAIGLLPTYGDAGLLAPICLVGLRFIQGIAVGGETVGAMVLTLEGVPAGRRGFYASVVQASGPLGIVAASLAVSVVSSFGQEALLSWGWRVPFLISAVLLLVGAVLRATVHESRHFEALKAKRAVAGAPVLEALRTHRGALVTAVLYLIAHTSYFYVVTIFAISHGVRTVGLSSATMTTAYFYANLLAVCCIPILGVVADRVGRRPLLLIGMSCEALFIGAYFALLASGSPVLATVAMLVAAGLINPICFAAEGSYIPELFPTAIRFSGASLAKQVGTVLGGGFAPVIATALSAHFGGSAAPVAGYVIIIELVAIVAISRAVETRGRAF